MNNYLVFNNFEKEYFEKRFPNICNYLRGMGYNVPKERVPISPAFHYAIGGIRTDLKGRVPDVKNLYAIGEVASTRVHGANRLASNSLLEGLVFASQAVEDILLDTKEKEFVEFEVLQNIMSLKEDKAKKNQLRRIMWENVSIIRTKRGLNDALESINVLLNENIGTLLKFRLLTAKEIVLGALSREKSIGVHTIQEEK
ncbi:MAG: FAD-binding protein, partial [Sulfurimonas sp.]|nr:FAD-binding protein [Sulfurimonas sp.]